MTDIRPWAAIGLTLLLIGGIIIWLTIPAVETEVVAHRSIVVGEPVTTLGTYHLEDGKYTVWIEDQGSGTPYEVRLLGEGEEQISSVPEESEGRTFEGIECRLLSLFSDVPEGDWLIVLKEVMDPPLAEGENLEVFIVKTPSERDRTVMMVGLVLGVSGLVIVLVLILTKGRWGRPTGNKNGEETTKVEGEREE